MIKLKRWANNPILTPDSMPNWAAQAVFNPAVIKWQNKIYMLYRAVGQEEHYLSRLGLAVSDDGYHFKPVGTNPVLTPAFDWEQGGVEDPRLTIINDKIYLTYTAIGQYLLSPAEELFDEQKVQAAGALAATADLQQFKRLGIITKTGANDKDVVLLPQKINGYYIMLHRPHHWSIQDQAFLPPGQTFDYLPKQPAIWLAKSRDLLNWTDHQVLIESTHEFDEKVGAGPPPILTDLGWLLIYHHVSRSKAGLAYTARMALLDKNNPGRVLAKLPGDILEPQEWYELVGDVNRVVFPTGALIINDDLLIYYGAADKYCALATASLRQVLSAFKSLL